MNTKTLTYEQALVKASALCSSSEHCPREIHEKLIKWGLQEEQAEEIVCRLMDEDFINEERYCHAFCNDKFRYNHWGKQRIRQELRMRQLPDRHIRQAVSEIDPQEYRDTLLHLLEQKLRSIKDENAYQRCGKLVRFAQSRGFGTELSLQIAQQLTQE